MEEDVGKLRSLELGRLTPEALFFPTSNMESDLDKGNL